MEEVRVNRGIESNKGLLRPKEDLERIIRNRLLNQSGELEGRSAGKINGDLIPPARSGEVGKRRREEDGEKSGDLPEERRGEGLVESRERLVLVEFRERSLSQIN